ncbi:hypothetical protein DLM78_19290 [Leptospira stimsonii]|uniref:Uncharacterized protein n=1 Tax=Leptospira stimsonii TaxID=2202203 RepID=A0A8B3CPR7_9LEPT|nr:hypothetical protein DLM78_19290 [Leptospira stimsonii]
MENFILSFFLNLRSSTKGKKKNGTQKKPIFLLVRPSFRVRIFSLFRRLFVKGAPHPDLGWRGGGKNSGKFPLSEIEFLFKEDFSERSVETLTKRFLGNRLDLKKGSGL